MRRLPDNWRCHAKLGGAFARCGSNGWRCVVLMALFVGLAAVPALGQADWYVKTTGSDSNDGQSWNTAFATIQKAVTSAIQFGGYEIWVADGTYTLSSGISIPSTGTKIPLQIIGGFSGDEVSLSEQDWVANPTVIDGNGVLESVITINHYIDLIDGFTITGGRTGYLGTGGAIDIRGCGSAAPQPVLRNLVITGNGGDSAHPPAYYEGGGIYIEDCSPWIVNTTFSNNRVWAHGGALFARDSDDSPLDTYPMIVNSTFTGNHSDVNGGAVGVYRGTLTVANSVLWGDTAGDGATNEVFGATLVISYSDIDQSGYAGVNGNIRSAPLLAGSSRPHLREGSPCIDTGSDAAVPAFLTTDFDGDDRFIDGTTGASGGTVDMGADEYVPGSFSGVWYVDADAGAAGDGLSWATAFQTIPLAVAAAFDGEEIWVAEGSYTASISIDKDVSLYGGFSGAETSRDQRDWNAHQSIIDGEDVRQCMAFLGGNAVVDGFTITRGKETIYQDGAVFVHPDATSVRFANTSFVANTQGGALYVNGAQAEIQSCSFKDNSDSMGGAITVVNEGSLVTIRDSVFSGNTALSYDGGAVVAFAAEIYRSTFFDNEGRYGGAVSIGGGNLRLENSEFFGNVARGRGGGLYISQYVPKAVVLNSTFYGNTANGSDGSTFGYGGAIRANGSSTSVVGSILWGNTASSGPQIGGFNLSVAYSDVDQAGYGEADGSKDANGNIRLDPLFTDPDGADDTLTTADDDLTLQASSPAVDAGDSTALVFGSVDLAGNPRHNDDPGVLDTGYGPAPMIDMGAYERQASTPQPTYDLTMSVSGSGTVAPPVGVHSYSAGSVVSVSASAASGWMFDGWTGWVEDPTSASTSVTMNWDRLVTANFVEAGTVSVVLQGDGVGTVTSSPAGINCPGDCDQTWQTGTSVTLSASTDPGTVFDGWVGGGCSGSGACELTIAEDESVVALCDLEGPCGLGDDMTLESISIDSDQDLEACSSITVGNGLVIEPPSHIVLRSGSIIVLENGFTVLEGANLTIEIYPDVGLEPAISVTKSANPASASEGDPITYTISVENTGEVPLAEVSVVDAKCDAAPVYQSGDDGDESLEVGETWVYQCSGIAESVTFVNTVTATFEDAIGVEVSDSGTVEVTVDIAACTAGARFADLGDGTVYDCWTELVWLENARCVDLPGTDWRGHADWNSAAVAAAALGDGICGLSDGSSPGDWRLPTMSELCGAWSGSWASGVGACDEAVGLINDNFTPSLSNAVGDGAWTEGDPFINVSDNYYWSSNDYDADFGWAAYFYSSVDVSTWYKTENLPVWPVRGTQ